MFTHSPVSGFPFASKLKTIRKSKMKIKESISECYCIWLIRNHQCSAVVIISEWSLFCVAPLFLILHSLQWGRRSFALFGYDFENVDKFHIAVAGTRWIVEQTHTHTPAQYEKLIHHLTRWIFGMKKKS